MIDLHSHLLPGVDDGSRSVAQSVGVLRAMAEVGLTDVCLTPHFRAGDITEILPPGHESAFAALTAEAPLQPKLHRGAEVMMDRPLAGSAAELRHITLAGTRYILVEFPRMVAGDTVVNALGRIVDLGLFPIVAHPERYSCCSPAAASRWRELGAGMQVDANTLIAAQARGQRARALVAQGLADILAGDNHGDDRTMAAGRRFLLAQGGEEQAELLTVLNPAAILRDEPLAPVPPLQIRVSLAQRIRELFEDER